MHPASDNSASFDSKLDDVSSSSGSQPLDGGPLADEDCEEANSSMEEEQYCESELGSPVQDCFNQPSSGTPNQII